MAERIKILIVDDHLLFREGLARLLASDRRFEVVAQAACGEEFLAAVEDLIPGADGNAPAMAPVGVGEKTPKSAFADGVATERTVVFLDIDMPGIGGVEAARRALERWPEMKIVALSMHGEQEFYLPMVEAGVKGFVLKSSDFSQVAAAAEAVSYGRTYFSQELVGSLVEALCGGGDVSGAQQTAAEQLTDREAEVLPLICEGLSNAEIADRLFISKRTVDKHRANILAKTECKNTASLVLYAVRHELIKL